MSDAKVSEKAQKRRVARSPSYPYIPVQKALEQAKALYDQEGEYAAPLSSAVSAWGYSPKSSGGRQTLATMKYYGLIDISGEGDSRKIKVSEIARRVLLDQRNDDREKRELIRRVALTPTAHKSLYEQYPKGLASDGSVEHFLVFDAGFNKDAASELLAEFKETARFIGLYEPTQSKGISTTDVESGENNLLPKFKAGDRVQVTVAGADLYADGATVLGLSDDGAWVFIDKSDAAAKVEEVTLIEPAATEPDRPPVPPHLLARKTDTKGTRKAVFPLSEGDVTLAFPDGISDSGLKRLKRYLEIFLDEQIDLVEENRVSKL